MPLRDFKIENYRSIREVWLRLNPVNVFVGPNGCGKSNLYRALYLMWTTANGSFARSIAEEGGINSVLWCGRWSANEAIDMRLSVQFTDLQFDLRAGFVSGDYKTRNTNAGRIVDFEAGSLFRDDVEIKGETLVRLKPGGSKETIFERRIAEVTARDARGSRIDYTMRVSRNESVITGIRDPDKFPELSRLRMELLNWRFYHHFRTDKDSPLRRPQIAVRTRIMAHDGSDFVSALATIQQYGEWDALLNSLNDAFPDSSLIISATNAGLKLQMRMPGLNRPLEMHELSDGTLQYLCLLAAIYSQEPPSLLALNEPETSIHPDLFEPLARLLASVSGTTQIWLTTHSQDLANYMEEFSGYQPQELEKVDGATRLVGVGLGGYRDEDEDEEENGNEDD